MGCPGSRGIPLPQQIEDKTFRIDETFRLGVEFQGMEDILNTGEAAVRLGVSARRVQQLIKSGRLPAREFGGSYMIAAGDLKLVEMRPPGRPPSKSNGAGTPKRAKKGGKKS